MRGKVLIPVVLLLLLALPSLGQEGLALRDPQGDASGYQVPPDAVAAVDILYVGVHPMMNGMAIVIETAGEQQGDGVYAYRVSVQDEASDKMYELILTISGQGAQIQGTYIAQLPTGAITIPIGPGDVEIRGATIIVNIDPAKAGISEAGVLLPTHDETLYSVQLVVEATYTATTGVAGDSASTIIDLGDRMGGEMEHTPPQPGEQQPPGDGYASLEPFKGKDSKAPGVSVEIKGTPKIRVTDTTINGIPYTVIEVEARGTASGASHVALAFETFIGDRLDTQIVYNMLTSPSGEVDQDGVANGFARSVQMPAGIGPQAPSIIVDEALEPLDGWSEWSYKSVYRIPAAQMGVVSKIAGLVQAIEAGEVEVYLTAIAFKDASEAEYTTHTKKADIQISTVEHGQQSPTQTTAQAEGDTEDAGDAGGRDGMPIGAIAAAAILILAAAGLAMLKIR